MKKTFALYLLPMMALFGCSVEKFVYQDDERYMRPGALDAPLTGYYDTYNFIFLKKYAISHQWPVTARSCQYRELPTLGQASERYKGEVLFSPEIYEANGSTWQRGSLSNTPPRSIDRFVRFTYKRQIPEFDAASKKTGRMVEKEETGLMPVCFEAWVGTSHAITVMLYKRTVAEWQAALNQLSQGSYVSSDAKRISEIVSGNKWDVYLVPLKPRIINRIAGPHELRILPIGTTDYTLAIELGANQDSLQHPEAHAKFKTMFRHLIESVRIEPLAPQIEAEHETLKRRALDVARKQCGQYKEPTPWCRQLLQQP